MRSPHWKRCRIFISLPHVASNSIHFAIALRAQRAQTSPAGATRSPYELRTPRVSSPEVDRAFPGPHSSIISTFAPFCWRFSAVHPPQHPAPITTTSYAARRLLTAGAATAGAAAVLVAAASSDLAPAAISPACRPATFRNSLRSMVMVILRGGGYHRCLGASLTAITICFSPAMSLGRGFLPLGILFTLNRYATMLA